MNLKWTLAPNQSRVVLVLYLERPSRNRAQLHGFGGRF